MFKKLLHMSKSIDVWVCIYEHTKTFGICDNISLDSS